MNYEEAVEYILNIPKFTKKNPMDNIKTLMKKLGNPEESMKVIHVAGTNGKGSVCAFLASILRQAGKTNAMFTSPHLIEINERFEINGKKVTNEVFTETFHIVINGVNQMIEEGYSHPTFFEFLFAMAMVIFKRAKVEYAILETGMGGRLDATNVIDKPVMTIITTIALDHMQILGDTIEEIAKEKAGIIKSNVVVVFDGTNEAASRVIEEIASKKRCKYYKLVHFIDQNVNENEFCYKMKEFSDKNIDFLLKYGYYGCIRVLIGMIGDYQMKNASLAIRAIQLLDEGIENETILKGIKQTKWPGRMEQLLPNVYLDGAHNENGIQEFINTVRHFKKVGKVLLFSALVEKDYERMIEKLCKELQFDFIIVTLLNNKRAIPVKYLQLEFEKHTKCKVFAIKDIEEAFNKLLELKSQNKIAFCAGSLYLVGEIKEIVRRMNYD